jgi:DNA-binding NtrC family response regulator
LQNKEIIKVGSSQVIKVDARIVAATNKDLPDLIHRKLFREDLYYRIDVIDIPFRRCANAVRMCRLLIQHITAQLCEEMGGDPLSFSDRAMNAMTAYSWPGNVRELENLIQKLIVTVDGNSVDIADLPGTMRFSIDHQNRPESFIGRFRTRVHPECAGQCRRQQNASGQNFENRQQRPCGRN